MLLTAAAVLDPATLQARSVGPAPIQPPRDAHQEFAQSLAGLISQCERVLTVSDNHNGVGAQIVLWSEDRLDPGRINGDELAVIRHSPMFQTVTVYMARRSLETVAWRGARPGLADAASRKNDVPLEAVTFTGAELAAPGVIDRWQAHPAVTARVISTAVSAMSLEAAYHAGNRWAPSSGSTASAPALSLFRLRLTWNDDSSDGAQSASALVESGRRRVTNDPRARPPIVEASAIGDPDWGLAQGTSAQGHSRSFANGDPNSRRGDQEYQP